MLNKRIIIAERPEETPLFTAILNDGREIKCYTSVHLMLVRRYTTDWKDSAGREVSDRTVYKHINKAVGYCV